MRDASNQAKFGERGAHGWRHSAVEFGSVWIQIRGRVAFRQIAPPLEGTPRNWIGRNKAGVKLDAAAQDAVGSPHLPQANNRLPRPDKPADHPIKRGLRPDTLPARRLPRDGWTIFCPEARRFRCQSASSSTELQPTQSFKMWTVMPPYYQPIATKSRARRSLPTEHKINPPLISFGLKAQKFVRF